VNWGTADTLVRRLDRLDFPEPGLPAVDTVPIEIIQMELRSVAPITVTYGGGSPEPWDVRVTLSPTVPPPGSMTVTKTHPNGGTFSAQFNVQPLFVFTRASPPAVRVLDTGAQPPLLLQTSGTPPWVHDCPNIVLDTQCGTNFVPGINDPTDTRVQVPAQAGPQAERNLTPACDDPDGDKVCTPDDNCPTAFNPTQNPNACVLPGLDYWETPPTGAQHDFSTDPIPASFFFPTSDPFPGTVCLGGESLNPGATGTGRHGNPPSRHA